MINIKSVLTICDKYKITVDELFFIRILLLVKEDPENKHLLNEYINAFNLDQDKLRNIVSNLQSKGIILKTKERCSFYELEVNKIFQKGYHKAAFDLGKELWDNYPMSCNINGALVPLRTIAKKFDSPEDFFRFYGKSIFWNEEKHQEILSLIKWANDKDIINQSLASFVINKSWEYLDSIKNEGVGNINYDAVRLI